MPLPTLPDEQVDENIDARLIPFLTEILGHRLNALAQGDRLDDAKAAHAAESTVETRAELREAKAALVQTKADIATITRAANSLDKIGKEPNSGTRVKNRANKAMADADAVVVPDEPVPTTLTP